MPLFGLTVERVKQQPKSESLCLDIIGLSLENNGLFFIDGLCNIIAIL